MMCLRPCNLHRRADPCGVRKTGRFSACREDSPPHGYMPRPQANLDSESLFHSQPEAIDAFGEAVSRGVDVRVMMPSAGGSDNPMVQHAGHRNFEKLLRCGVRLLEYPHTLLRQKVMTIDGVWSAVGSSNFDDRSFETNDEITLGIRNPATAQRLDADYSSKSTYPIARKLSLRRGASAGYGTN